MQNYIQKIQELLDIELGGKGSINESLLGIYALLVLVIGENCTNEDVHDAWSVWSNVLDPKHRSLIPFNELTKEVQDLDEPYKQAIIKVAKLIKS